MKRHPITHRPIILQKAIELFPKDLRLRFNVRRYYTETFMRKAQLEIMHKYYDSFPDIIDIGAGPQPYRHYFSFGRYKTTDIEKFEGIDIVCPADKLKVPRNSQDAILCVEVLEHVPDPQKVINEFYRVLRKGGRVYLTTPQGWMMHQIPHNYFYFTKYGLKLLFENAGFKIISMEPQGGYFNFLADTFKTDDVIKQYRDRWFYWFIRVPTYPFNHVIFPFLSFYLDKIDKLKLYTCGWMVVAEK